MSTRAEALFAAAVAALVAALPPLVAAQNVFRENEFHLDEASELPAVTVQKLTDAPDGRRDFYTDKRVLTLRLNVYTSAETSTSAETIRLAAFDALRTLSADPEVEECREGAINYQFDQLNAAICGLDATYEIDYAVNQNTR